MTQPQQSRSSKNPFSEARKMVANELYVPSKWGKIEVDNSGDEPKIVYEYSNNTEEKQEEFANQE